MTEQDRVVALKTQHRDLESAIELETKRPAPDDLRISTLKRQKLRIKDELASLDAL